MLLTNIKDTEKTANRYQNLASCENITEQERKEFLSKANLYETKLQNLKDIQKILFKKEVKNDFGLKIGDIIYEEISYENTTITFYQIINTTKKTITIAEIQSKRVGDFKKDPIKNDFHGNKAKKITLKEKIDDKGFVKFTKCGLLYKYAGKALYFSEHY